MQELNKPLYIESPSVYDMNEKIKEGYEFVTVVYREHNSSQSTYNSLNGNFMGNPISLDGNINTPTVQKSTYYLMKLTNTGNLLYGQS